MRRDVELFRIAADSVYVGNTLDSFQLRPHDPVLNGSQVHSGVCLSIRRLRAWLGFDRPEEDLSETGGDRPHPRLDAWRELALDLLHPLGNALARPVNIGAVLENHRDLREAIARYRSRLLQSRQARHRCFDEVRYAL